MTKDISEKTKIKKSTRKTYTDSKTVKFGENEI